MINKFKDSRLGKIPNSWEVVHLEDVCIPKKGMRRGPFGGAIKKAFFVEKGYQVYEQRNAIYDDFETARYYIEEDKYNELKAFKVEANDFIISCSGTIGRIAKVPENFKKGVINQALLRLRLDRNIITDNYFLQQFRSEPFQNKITDSTQGGAMKNLVGMAEFRKTLLTLPPLPEQQKIAEILSTVDAKIDLITQRISQTQDLKKGLMQRLLTKGIGHTQFKDSPLGEIPKSWEVTPLISHIKLLSGFAFKSDGFNEEGRGTKLLRGINITTGNLRWNKKLDRWWDLPFVDFDKYSAEVGDLVISMDGSLVGRNYARVKEQDLPLLLVQRVACLRAESSLNLEYLNQIIGSPLWLNYVDAVKTSSGIPHISAKNIREFKIPFPSLKEQTQIANILSTVDSKLDVLQNKKTHYQDLKKGLMQQLLTGKVRVTGFN